MYQKVAHNKRRAVILMAVAAGVVTIVVGSVGLALGGGWVALLVAVVVAAAAVALAWRTADTIVLRVGRAEPAEPDAYARYHNLVEGLCVVNGITKPDLYVIHDDALNGFATGRGPARSSLALTTGLLESLDRLSLEGVIAHELSRIRHNEVLVGTLAVVLVAPVTLAGDLLIRHRWWNGGRHGHDDPQPRTVPVLAALGRALLVTSPVVARLMKATVSRERELVADMDAVDMTRYPPGLLHGLEQMDRADTVVHASARSTAHLWMADPLALTQAEGELSHLNRLFASHPPLSQRVDSLREL